MGNGFILPYLIGMFLATKDEYLTRQARFSAAVAASKLYVRFESGNHETISKEVNGRKVKLRLGVHEKGAHKYPIRSYQEPGEVPLAE